MSVGMARRFATMVALASVTTFPTVVHATPEFPAAVVQDLKLPGITVGAPQGCTLCHTTDAGGTSVKPFGQLLERLGVRPYDPPSLQQALAELETEEPRLVEDIRAGRDPSDDTTGTHSPEYGCSATAPHPRPPFSPESAIAVVVAALLLKNRRGHRRLAGP